MTVLPKKNKKTSKQQLADNLFTVEVLDENNSVQATIDGEKNDEIPVDQDDEIVADFKVFNEEDKPQRKTVKFQKSVENVSSFDDDNQIKFN